MEHVQDTLLKVGDLLFQHVHKRFNKSYPELSKQDGDIWPGIIELANVVELPSGTHLLQPNSPCTQFMLLLEGRVRVFQRTPNDREVTLYRIQGGDLCVLSIQGMIQYKNFGAFAQCETEISALTFTRDQFMQAMASYAPFREFILFNLTDRFNDVLALMEETVFESLDTRLICFLARCARENKSDVLNITHQELARELGSSREVMSRLLKVLEKQDCIKLGRGVIHIKI